MAFGTSLRDKLRDAHGEQLSSFKRYKPELTREEKCLDHIRSVPKAGAVALSAPEGALWDQLDQCSLRYSVEALRLAGIIRAASDDRRIHTVLYWPFPQKKPAFAHALACISSFMDGDREEGIRTILWPAKTNACRSFGDIRVNMNVLGQQAQAFASKYETNSPDLPHKLIVLMNLKNKLECAPIEDWPVLSEIVPSFPYSNRIDTDGWGDKPMYLKHSRSSVSSLELLKDLGSPLRAPDALFRLHPRYQTDDFERLLARSVMGQNPDAAILDMRGATLYGVEKWWVKFNQLLFMLQGLPERRQSVFGNPLGVVILLDDPFRYARVLLHLRHLYKNFDEQVRRHESLTSTGHYSWPGDTSFLPCARDLPDLEVNTDFDASRLSEDLFKLAKKTRAIDATAAEALREAGCRFRRLTSLPFGIGDFARGIREANADSDAAVTHFTRKHLWWPAWGEVRDHLENGDFGLLRNKVEEGLKAADDLIQSCDKQTVASLWLRRNLQNSEGAVIVCNSELEANILSELCIDWRDTRPAVLHAKEILASGRLMLPDQIDHLIVLSGPLTLRVVFAFPAVPRQLTLFLDHLYIRPGLTTLRALRACAPLRQHHRLAEILLSRLESMVSSVPATRISELLNSLQDVGSVYEKYDLSLVDEDNHNSSAICRIVLEEGVVVRAGSRTRVTVIGNGGDFARAYAEDLSPGDLIVLPPDSYHRFVRGLSDDSLERLRNMGTRSVMKRIDRALKREFPGVKGTALTRAVLAKLHEKFPHHSISLHQVQYWLSGPGQIDADKDVVLQTRSARRVQDFLAFASVIGIPEEDALEDLWPTIREVRIERQKIGRSRSQLFDVLLHHPENVIRLLDENSRDIVDMIRNESRENAMTIEEVQQPS